MSYRPRASYSNLSSEGRLHKDERRKLFIRRDYNSDRRSFFHFICSRSGLILGREITVLCCILRRVSLDQGAPIFFEIDPDIMKTQRVLITENRKHLHISRVNNVFSFFNKKYIISKLAKWRQVSLSLQQSASCPRPLLRQHLRLSCDDCLEGKIEDYQNCISNVYSHMHIDMSSAYWFLSSQSQCHNMVTLRMFSVIKA